MIRKLSHMSSDVSEFEFVRYARARSVQDACCRRLRAEKTMRKICLHHHEIELSTFGTERSKLGALCAYQLLASSRCTVV